MEPVRVSYHDVLYGLRRRIEAGLYPPDTKLPTQDDLARQFGTTPATVNRAIRELCQLGLLVVRRGRPHNGTFVARPMTITRAELADLLQPGDIVVVRRGDPPTYQRMHVIG